MDPLCNTVVETGVKCPQSAGKDPRGSVNGHQSISKGL